VTTVTWRPVSGAAAYGVEIDCFHCCQVNRWCSDVQANPTFRVDGTLYTPILQSCNSAILQF